MPSFPRHADRSGIAALEFALLVPVLVVIFLAVADFGLLYYRQLQMASALAAGAEYAFTKGQSETGATLTADVSNFVNTVSPVPATSSTASFNGGLSATSCYCVAGSPAVFTGPLTCGAACTDSSGSTAGKYISITGSFSYAAMFVLDQVLFPASLAQTVTVRLQ